MGKGKIASYEKKNVTQIEFYFRRAKSIVRKGVQAVFIKDHSFIVKVLFGTTPDCTT